MTAVHPTTSALTASGHSAGGLAGSPRPPGSPQRSRLRAWLPVGALAPFLAAAAFVLRFNPTDQVADPTGPCAWHAITGSNGPTCGGTRMFFYLIHGDVVNAARHHLPALLAAPFLVYAWLRWALGAWFGFRLPALRFGWKTYLAYGIFWVVFTMVLRNLSWGPFAWFDIPNLDMG